MTELCETGENGTSMFSGAVSSDDRWHRIGAVWSGTQCVLPVDEQEVARGEQAELRIQGDVLMTCSAMLSASGRLFAILIDDARIYNRAVKR